MNHFQQDQQREKTNNQQNIDFEQNHSNGETRRVAPPSFERRKEEENRPATTQRPKRNRRSARHQTSSNSGRMVQEQSSLPLSQKEKGNVDMLGRPMLSQEEYNARKRASYQSGNEIDRQEDTPESMTNSQVHRAMAGQGRPGRVERPQQQGDQMENRRSVPQRRSQPVPEYLQQERTRPVKPKKKTLSVVVLILLIIGFFIVGFALLPPGDTGFLGKLFQVKSSIITTVNRFTGNAKNLLGGQEEIPLEVKSFTALPKVATAPAQVAFTIETSTSVKSLRLTNTTGEILEGTTNIVNNENSTIWTITVSFEEAFTQDVLVQISDGSQDWKNSEKIVEVHISSPMTQGENGTLDPQQQVWNKEGPVAVDSQ
ncbi:MAG: hypothetical protein GX786_00515, partial [Clostridiales bacterium]|nr:hypothetical protein [Clostridiales bacterium]